ncbi:MAG: SDR family oxidoreductase [Deltaproteobacteria bacterium]|nr:SDR family oxidoreductase [Deltaproteobacteria bacterium]MBW2304590.1 SDR family oxidoreductase [Deltaproteobacteria bacterium]
MGLLEGKVSLITGADTEIGREIARRFLQEGARKVILFSEDEKVLSGLCGSLDPAGERVGGVFGEIRGRDDAVRTIEDAVKEAGRIDILINNFDLMEYGPVSPSEPGHWNRVLNANLNTAMFFMSAVIPMMKESGGGVIVNVSSLAGNVPFSGLGAYCASHAALQAFSKVAAKEVASFNIRVNIICPPIVEETGTEGSSSELLGRNGDPGSVADAALFLVSDRSEWLTGVTLDLDGGRHLAPGP